MNVIIEGPDAIGKTILSKKLNDMYNMQIMHLTSKTPNDYEYHNNLLDKDNYVFDRFFMGELVYPEIYKRKPKISSEEAISLFEKVMDNNDIFIIMYASDINILIQRLRERNELDFLENIEQQNNKYYELSELYKIYNYSNLIIVDICSPNAYTELDKILNLKLSNMNTIYRDICAHLLTYGHKVNNTREINNYTFTLQNINNNIVTLKTRNISIPYCVGELLWYWSGRNDVEFISKFGSLWSKISDDGKTNNSAYGYILKYKHGFDQIEKIIELLKTDKNSRRAVLNINVPNENVITTKDEMCTIALVFYIRDDKLYCTGIMRSNDIWYGLTYDIIYFTELQKYIADKLNVKYGSYTHIAVSMHCYERDAEKIYNIAKSNTETINIDLNISKIYENMEELLNYVDYDFESKEKFFEKLSELKIITERGNYENKD